MMAHLFRQFQVALLQGIGGGGVRGSAFSFLDVIVLKEARPGLGPCHECRIYYDLKAATRGQIG